MSEKNDSNSKLVETVQAIAKSLDKLNETIQKSADALMKNLGGFYDLMRNQGVRVTK